MYSVRKKRAELWYVFKVGTYMYRVCKAGCVVWFVKSMCKDGYVYV